MDRLLHTPEGVRDIYNGECAAKAEIQKRIRQVFHSYGYRDIETPTFEYFEVFSREVGTTPSRELYKFFDREGNTLVLRPDFTPSIARAYSTYFHEERKPVRLCYQGNTFINNSSYQGRYKESTQMGVEYIGSAGAECDGEILALVAELLQKCGLREFQISVGQVDFFKSLLEEAQMSEETVEQLRKLISNKNYFGVEELIEEQNLDRGLENAFLQLPQLFGSVEVLDKAKELTNNEKALKAISRLEKIYEILTCYGCEKFISFDLAMLSKYHYYTGIIFQAYTYGTGEALVKGGRYNNLLAHFGKPAPSVGFGIVMEHLMNALSRQGIVVPVEEGPQVISYREGEEKTAIEKARNLRSQGIAAELRKEEDL